MKNNNFDILRLICALLVIVSHSYDLLGLNNRELLLRYTGWLSASGLGLCGFFTISGYLILNSLYTSKNVFTYFIKRCLRIFPGLLVCLVLIVLGCSFFYTGEEGYWMQKETYSFIWNNLGLYTIQWEGIPGVFSNNPISMIDGSLWTLAHEFTLYLLIIGLFLVRKYKHIITGLTIVALALCLTKNIFFADKFAHTEILHLGVNSFSRFAQFFLTGMLLLNRQYFRTGKSRIIGICICIVFAIGLLCINTTHYTIHPIVTLFISILFILLGEMYWQPVSDGTKRLGDMSYGIYIYAFPIQQMLIATMPNINPIILTFLTIAIVLPIAYASWHLIEKRALALKKQLE